MEERRRAELALRQSEERFRRAQAAAKIGAFECDLATGRLVWAAEIPSLAGLVPQNRLRDWQRLIHPEDLPRVRDLATQLPREGGDCSLEFRLLRPDGSVIWILFVPVSLHHHHPPGCGCESAGLDL